MGDIAELYDWWWPDDDELLYDGERAGEGRMYDDEPSFGPGECPECGEPTRLIATGPHGLFYGCTKWPACRGSRQFDSEDLDKGVVYANGVRLPTCELHRAKKARGRSIFSKIAGVLSAGRGPRKAERGARRAE